MCSGGSHGFCCNAASTRARGDAFDACGTTEPTNSNSQTQAVHNLLLYSPPHMWRCWKVLGLSTIGMSTKCMINTFPVKLHSATTCINLTHSIFSNDDQGGREPFSLWSAVILKSYIQHMYISILIWKRSRVHSLRLYTIFHIHIPHIHDVYAQSRTIYRLSCALCASPKPLPSPTWNGGDCWMPGLSWLTGYMFRYRAHYMCFFSHACFHFDYVHMKNQNRPRVKITQNKQHTSTHTHAHIKPPVAAAVATIRGARGESAQILAWWIDGGLYAAIYLYI